MSHQCFANVGKSLWNRQCKNMTRNENGFCHKHQKLVPESDECPVCYDTVPCEVFQCGHKCCLKCGKEWFKEHTNCPMCRAYVKQSTQPIKPEVVLQELVRTMTQEQSEIHHILIDGDTSEEVRRVLVARIFNSFTFTQQNLFDFWERLVNE